MKGNKPYKDASKLPSHIMFSMNYMISIIDISQEQPYKSIRQDRDRDICWNNIQKEVEVLE